MTNVPYNPMSRTGAFADLVGKGMDADRAFVILTLIAADTFPGEIDAQHMREIREIAEAYVEYTGQAELVSILGKTEDGTKGER